MMPDAATGPVAREIIERLTAALAPTQFELEDQSHQHVGHAGHDSRGESHFALTIESPAFAGLSRVIAPLGKRRFFTPCVLPRLGSCRAYSIRSYGASCAY